MFPIKDLYLYTTLHHLTPIICPLLTLAYFLYKRRSSRAYLLDFACFRPPNSSRVPFSMFQEHITHDTRFDPESLAFQVKILEKSGFSDETCISAPLRELPMKRSYTSARLETEAVLFSVVDDLLRKTKVNPKLIDILICNSCMFSPTPSMSAMVVNKFRMRSNVRSYNLSGMGCSAGIAGIGLANDLLRVHPNSLALVVSTEILALNWYTGKNPSMLLTNCLFRMGGAAVLMSSRGQDKKTVKYELKHLVRTSKAHDSTSYSCVYQDHDDENELGVSISKDVVNVAGSALKANIESLGPLVLPYSEQMRYTLTMLRKRLPGHVRVHVPDFKKAFEHFCVHAGGRSVIQAIEKSLNLSKKDVEASNMTLYRFGNVSSSSIWYELLYTESKGEMKKGDRIWQIAFGSGFKCNSAVWKCVNVIGAERENAWSDSIDSYPVEVPHVVRID